MKYFLYVLILFSCNDSKMNKGDVMINDSVELTCYLYYQCRNCEIMELLLISSAVRNFSESIGVDVGMGVEVIDSLYLDYGCELTKRNYKIASLILDQGSVDKEIKYFWPVNEKRPEHIKSEDIVHVMKYHVFAR